MYRTNLSSEGKQSCSWGGSGRETAKSCKMIEFDKEVNKWMDLQTLHKYQPNYLLHKPKQDNTSRGRNNTLRLHPQKNELTESNAF